LTKQSYFSAPGPHHALFLCLTYLAHCPSMCSWQDCSDALVAYEQALEQEADLLHPPLPTSRTRKRRNNLELPAPAPVTLHPLYILAHSRLAARDNPVLQNALLWKFCEQYPETLGRTVDGGGWITDSEWQVLFPPQSPRVAHTVDAHCALEQRWHAVDVKLAFYRTVPLFHAAEALLRLVGQRALKEAVVEMSEELLLHCERFPWTVTPVIFAPNRMFVLVGESGTGKTTAARLLARVMGEASLPTGHKVVQYTAKEAMRAGAKHFAKEVATLTGGAGHGSAPPTVSNYFRKGMHVEVKHGDQWYAGQVTKADRANGQYSAVYADGTEDDNLTVATMRCVTAATTAGGVLVLDDAHLLDPAHSDGAEILSSIADIETDPAVSKVGVVLTTTLQGYQGRLCSAIPGLQHAYQVIHLDAFTEGELSALWLAMCEQAGWKGDAECDGVKVSDVAARKLAQSSTAPSFANAHTVRALLNTAIASAKRPPNHLKRLSVEDIVGVPPISDRIPALAAALQQLQDCVGVTSVKESIHSICSLAHSNYRKELRGQRPDAIPLNRLFLGNPGTGKSTVASIYGQILKQLKLLSKGDVITRKASEFIGSYAGQSEGQTREILTAARGCVLIIDEAYTLSESALFGKSVLNTLVECVSGEAGDDLAVVLIGYERDMLRMLDEQNPGLRSRFDPAYAFRFDDFSDMELLQIFGAACAGDQVEAPIDVKRVAVKQLVKARSMKNFGNARAVQGLYSVAKSRMTQRLRTDPSLHKVMTLADVLGREQEVLANPLQCIEELQGGEDQHGFRTVLRQIGSSIQVCKMENRPVDPVGNFIFTGAPGTGKTTVARKMAQMLHALGVLASDHVVLTTALDLTGQFTGQTKKVIEGKMEEARGGVLFIDEAYKLGEGQFGDEVMVKLLGMLTEPEYCGGRTIVILAGYDADMHTMLARNAGMASRFSECMHFADWTAAQCVSLAESLAQRERPIPFALAEGAQAVLLEGFTQLIQRPGWANARDAETLYKLLKKCRDRRLVAEYLTQNNTGPLLAHATVVTALEFSLSDATAAVAVFMEMRKNAVAPTAQPAISATNAVTSAEAVARTVTTVPQSAPLTAALPSSSDVTDTADARSAADESAEEDGGDSHSDEDGDRDDDGEDGGDTEVLTAAQRAALDAKQAQLDEDNRRAAQELAALQERAAELSHKEKQRVLALQKVQEEAQRQQALQKLGRCVMGYAWQKVSGGYRCCGGGHFVGDGEVERRRKELFV
jgi:SpoVK/Ycf46/Vps4 family AAA+-type ATPase